MHRHAIPGDCPAAPDPDPDPRSAAVEALFQAFCEGAERNPDNHSDEEEGGAGGFFYDEDAALAGIASAALGVGDVDEVRCGGCLPGGEAAGGRAASSGVFLVSWGPLPGGSSKLTLPSRPASRCLDGCTVSRGAVLSMDRAAGRLVHTLLHKLAAPSSR